MTRDRICEGCGGSFSDAEWLDRHTVDGTDADIDARVRAGVHPAGRAVPGDYHDRCCPLLICVLDDGSDL